MASYPVAYHDELGRAVQDVASYYERGDDSVVAAERCGANVLILREEGERWALSYHWLASETADLCRVMGAEVSHWAKGELDSGGRLFEQVSCF